MQRLVDDRETEVSELAANCLELTFTPIGGSQMDFHDDAVDAGKEF